MSFEEQPPTTTVRIGLPARARLAFVALGAVFGLVLAVGILGPTSPRVVRPSDAAVGTIAPLPSAPSRPPAAAPSPTAEHLPQLERYGRAAPWGNLLVLAEASHALGPGVAHRVLGLGTGRLGPPLTADPILPLADGGFLCACVDRPWSASTDRASIRAIRLSARGDAGEASGSLDLEGISPPDESPSLAFSTAFAPVGEFVAVAAAERDGSGDWRIRLGVVGFDRPPATLELETVPGGSVLAVNPLDPVVSPDGRTIAVQVAVFRRTESGDGIGEGATWLVHLRGARLGPALSLDGPGRSGSFAEFTGFTSPDLYARVVPAADGILGWDVRTYDLEGRLLHAASLEPAPERPMFAAAGGAILAWDGIAHIAYRVDRLGALTRRSVDPAVALGPGWRTADRETAPKPAMAAAPAGDRLYAVGYELGPGAEAAVPSIWVLGGGDGSLDALDRWSVDGRPTSMAVSPDGRWLFVAAEAGVTSDGRASTRQASVAAYDTTTGVRALFAGRLGTGFLELARGP